MQKLSEQRLLLPNLSDYHLLKSVTSEETRNFIIIMRSPSLSNTISFAGDEVKCFSKIFSKSRHIIINFSSLSLSSKCQSSLAGRACRLRLGTKINLKLSVRLFRFSFRFGFLRMKNFQDIWNFQKKHPNFQQAFERRF